MMDMLKHYTLEQLQETDIDLLLPLYRWYCRQHSQTDKEAAHGEKIVMRGGKPYKVMTAGQADWAKHIF